MYIRPIQELSLGRDIIKANCLRRAKVQNVLNSLNLIDSIFLKLKKAIMCNDIMKVAEILMYELFFEIIPDEYISLLVSVYNNTNNKDNFINLLKNTYIDKGNRGFLFSFTPIINSF